MKTYCIICQKEDTSTDKVSSAYLSLPAEIRVVRCRHCDLRWLYPMKTTDEYNQLYKSLYFETIPEDYEKLSSERTIHYHKRLTSIKDILNKKKIRLLDVGAATGEFIHEALKLRIDAIGIEPSSSACKAAREKYRIDILQGDFLDFDFNGKTFDAIHMHHVFEHMPDPHSCLQKVSQVLSEDGLFVFEVPNQFDNILYIVSNALGRARPKPFDIYSIHHPFFYNSKNLSLLLSQHDFEILTLRTWKSYLKIKSGSFYPFASSIERMALILADLLFKKGIFIEIYAKKRSGRTM
jgi:SAM-dependent methyltransferase